MENGYKGHLRVPEIGFEEKKNGLFNQIRDAANENPFTGFGQGESFILFPFSKNGLAWFLSCAWVLWREGLCSGDGVFAVSLIYASALVWFGGFFFSLT